MPDRPPPRDSRPATLYVVATPLGNLGDLTVRAADVLRAVPVVAAEDTRRTRGLLSHLGASARLMSLHAHSDLRRLDMVVGLLLEGQDVAYVTDAGTPGISDPGTALVARVKEAGVPVVPLPGPSAVAAALSASGLPADRFVFLGFLPRKGRERDRLLRQAAEAEWTVVLFEAPGRLVDLLRDLAALAGGDRRAVVARELTKVHEEFRAGTLDDLAEHWSVSGLLGECTVVLEGKGPALPAPGETEAAARAMATRLLSEGYSRRDVVRMVSDETAVPRNLVYRIVTELP